MTRTLLLAFALCLVTGLVACDSSPRKSAIPPSYEPVPSGDAAAPSAPAAGTGANTGGTYPYGTAQPTAPAEGEAPVVRTPDGRLWRKAGTTEDQRQADLAACYEVAAAQVRRDEQIMVDQDATMSDFSPSSRMRPLQRQMQGHDLRNRRSRIMSSCLESKGYYRL